MRLLCFPHAGGSASTFRHWSKHLSPEVTVVAIEYPGRGRRVNEPLPASTYALVKTLVGEVVSSVEGEPFAMFGHSLGGQIAFELAWALENQGLPRPLRLILAASSSPNFRPTDRLHQLPDKDLVIALQTLNGVPKVVLENEELVELMLPIVRSDLRMAETSTFHPPGRLGIPVSLLSGDSDPLVSSDSMKGWSTYFDAAVEHIEYPGDHFFVQGCMPLLMADLRRLLLNLT